MCEFSANQSLEPNKNNTMKKNIDLQIVTIYYSFKKNYLLLATPLEEGKN